ncbi:MAG: hypothetical protein RLZZ458_1375 [Planctomycetota bacterium]
MSKFPQYKSSTAFPVRPAFLFEDAVVPDRFGSELKTDKTAGSCPGGFLGSLLSNSRHRNWSLTAFCCLRTRNWAGRCRKKLPLRHPPKKSPEKLRPRSRLVVRGLQPALQHPQSRPQKPKFPSPKSPLPLLQPPLRHGPETTRPLPASPQKSPRRPRPHLNFRRKSKLPASTNNSYSCLTVASPCTSKK